LRELLSDAEVDALAPGVIDSGVPSCGLTRLAFDRTWIVHEVGVVRP
jgi:hypothetical protein